MTIKRQLCFNTNPLRRCQAEYVFIIRKEIRLAFENDNNRFVVTY